MVDLRLLQQSSIAQSKTWDTARWSMHSITLRRTWSLQSWKLTVTDIKSWSRTKSSHFPSLLRFFSWDLRYQSRWPDIIFWSSWVQVRSRPLYGSNFKAQLLIQPILSQTHVDFTAESAETWRCTQVVPGLLRVVTIGLASCGTCSPRTGRSQAWGFD